MSLLWRGWLWNKERAMLRPAFAHPSATLRLPIALPRSPAQCGAAQQPGGMAELKI